MHEKRHDVQWITVRPHFSILRGPNPEGEILGKITLNKSFKPSILGEMALRRRLLCVLNRLDKDNRLH